MVTRSALILLLSLTLAQAAPYSQWITGWGLSGNDTATNADPDGDGLPNLMEYVIDGCNPAMAENPPRSPRLVAVTREGDGWADLQIEDAPHPITEGWMAGKHFGLRFGLRPGISGVGVRPEFSRDLVSWYSGRSAFLSRELTDGTLLLAHLAPADGQRFFYRATAFLLPDENAPVTWVSLQGDELLAGTPVDAARIVGGASTVAMVEQDREITRAAAADGVYDVVWDWAWRGVGDATVERVSSNPAVIVPDTESPLRWTYQSTGNATISLRTGAQTISRQVQTRTFQDGVVDTLTGVVPGSLRRVLQSTIDDAIAGLSANATTMNIYSVQDHTGGNYTRNPQCWAAPWVQALTALSPWNSAGGTQYAGTLISPRHVLFAKHFNPPVGTTVRWVAADNTVVSRTLTNVQGVTASVPGYTEKSAVPDFTIGVLDSDVPASISYARILPADWREFIPELPAVWPSTSGLSSDPLYCIPVFATNQYEQALVKDWNASSTATIDGVAVPDSNFGSAVPLDAQRLSFDRQIIGGDSGNPVGVFIGGQFVLFGVWTSPTGGNCPRGWASEINAAMTSLGGGYQLTPIDLSAYPQY